MTSRARCSGSADRRDGANFRKDKSGRLLRFRRSARVPCAPRLRARRPQRMTSVLPAVTIRPAGPADADVLAAQRFAFRATLDPVVEPEPAFRARCAAWMTARLAPGGAWRCWVAEADGAILGTVWLELIEKMPNPVAEPEYHGYISNLLVAPAHRGGGLGAALLEAALAEADRCRVDAVILWPTPRSRSLYQRHGFRVRDDLMERRHWAHALSPQD